MYDENYVFSFVGLMFIIFGLMNKEKWEKDKRRFGKLDKGEKRLLIFTIIILFVLFVAGFIAFLFLKGY
jgi:cytochrome b subunit of formate dehydrogenase